MVITNVIGTGIFLTPAFIAQRAGGPLTFLGLWVAGGVLAVLGALAYAELAAMRPRAGGEYVYIGEAFGPLAGFLSGWTSLVAGFSGAIAAAAVGFALYLERLVPGLASTDPLLRAPLLFDLSLTVTPRALVAIGLIGLFSLVHGRGIGPGRLAQHVLAWVNVGTILVLVVAGLAAVGGLGAAGGVALPEAREAAAGAEPGGLFVALVLVMFTYSGWNAAAYVAGEFREPGRALPRALLGGTAAVIVLYLALNVLYVLALGIGGIAGAEATGERVAAVLWGTTGVGLFTPLVLLVLASSVSAMVLTGPRVYYAMARDRCLPPAFGRLGAGRVPAFSIGVQGLWSSLLVLTGGFEALLTYTGFAVVLFAGLGVASLFVLRWKRPDAPRPFRAWGYPFTPAIFIAASAAMVIQSVLRAPGPSLAGLGLVALGVPFFAWTRARSGAGTGRS